MIGEPSCKLDLPPLLPPGDSNLVNLVETTTDRSSSEEFFNAITYVSVVGFELCSITCHKLSLMLCGGRCRLTAELSAPRADVICWHFIPHGCAPAIC
jgi:hypothetical protein